MVRRHLRYFAAWSLLLQSAWLFALVPVDCCAAHTPAKSASCHEEVQPTHCPMKDASGAACPMHADGAAEQHGAGGRDCRMNAACAGPMSALISLLSAHGVLTAPLATVSQARTILPLTDGAEQPITQFVPPDSPPPRA